MELRGVASLAMESHSRQEDWVRRIFLDMEPEYEEKIPIWT